MDAKELGNHREGLRRAAGMTQLELAATARVSMGSVMRAEAGAPLAERTIRAIAAALNVTAAEYLGPDVAHVG